MATEAELGGVRQHLVNFVPPEQVNFTVHQYKASTLPLIQQLLDDRIVPVRVDDM